MRLKGTSVLKAGIFAAGALALLVAPANAQQPYELKFSGTPSGATEDFTPPGTLYDNDVNDGTTSLASQNSTQGNFARVADDFNLVDSTCATQNFDITQVRVQFVRTAAGIGTPSIEFYADNGMGTEPDGFTPTPGTEYSFTTQTNLGPFGAGTVYEFGMDTTGLQLPAGIGWLSAFGADDTAGFSNFWAVSAGAAGTTANGLFYSPDFNFNVWTDAGTVIMSPPIHFSFAIDGVCAAPNVNFQPDIPTLSPLGLGLMIAALLAASLFVFTRRRRTA